MSPTLIDALLEKAQVQPHATAYVYLGDGLNESSQLTYGGLDRRARAIAATLQAASHERNVVLLLFPQGLEFLEAFFGCLYSGSIGVPLPSLDNARFKRALPRLATVAENAGATVVLTTEAILAMRDEICSHLPALASLQWLAAGDVDDSAAADWTRPAIAAADVAYLQYSSGSTSKPKGIMISHANVMSNLACLVEAVGCGPADASVTWLPHFHDYGLVHGLLTPFCAGGKCYVMSPLTFLKRPVRWLQAISRYKATYSQAPTFGYDYCARKVRAEECGELDLGSWKNAGISAEPIRLETMGRFDEVFRPYGFGREIFSPAYGLAEATLGVTGYPSGRILSQLTLDAVALERDQVVEVAEGVAGSRVLCASGILWKGIPVRIVDPATCLECSPGQVGEIWCAGESVALGYWGQPEETQKTFQAKLAAGEDGNFLRTGDLGFIAQEQLFVTGRLKDLIIIAGSNHYPQDVEATVEASHADLRPLSSAAFSVEVDGQERLVIVAEAKPRDKDLQRISDSIRQAVVEQHGVDPYAITLLRHGGILKTSSGKIQRSACRAAFLAGRLDVLTEVRYSQPSVSDVALPSEDGIREWLIARFAALAGVKRELIDVNQPLALYGMTSIEAVATVTALEDWLHKDLPATLLYQYSTIEALASWLSGKREDDTPEPVAPYKAEPIAIVGMGCRFPGANGPEGFWRLLRDGAEAITEVPAERWDVQSFYSPEAGKPGKMNTRWGGFLQNVGDFDAQFFGISPREATHMDPQQRILLEVAVEALENAGIPAESVAGTQAGVFVGISTTDYAWLALRDAASLDTHSETGCALSIAANRISYTFDFHGPSMAVDTACSSSMTAVHLACESLRRGQSSMALAGGVNLILTPEWTVAASQAGMMSPDGRCKVFDSQANGYVRGEGCGLVVLKRLPDALQDGDPIVALIRGTAVNQDGRSNGLTAPNPVQQQRAIESALNDAGVAARDIGYVEAHGTGTPLGDPIEFQALSAVIGKDREAPCLLGSVKANIGHLEAGAGIAGLIKTALSLSHGEVPPQFGLQEVNPYIKVAGSGLRIATVAAPWPRTETPRFAGVSCFGVGGSNAHAVLEEAPPVAARDSQEKRTQHLLTISARTDAALKEAVKRYEDYLRGPDEFSDIAYTSNTGRTHFAHRLAVIAGTSAEARQRLSAGEVFRGVVEPGNRPTVAPGETSLSDLGELYVRGAVVDWDGFHKDSGSRKVVLPNYPFQRRRYWISAQPKERNVAEVSQPWPGRRLISPVIRDVVFQMELSPASMPLLRDHVVYGRMALPGSAYLSMALAGIKAGFGEQRRFSITDCKLAEALVLSEADGPITLQTIFTDNSFQIVSLASETWRVHATGKVRAQSSDVAPHDAMKLETIQTQRGAAMSSAELYSLLKQLSLDYGAGFQGVTEVWRRKGDALGRIRKPAQSSGEYVFDPVLLDSCFHLVAAAQDHDGVEEAFVPVQFDAVDIFGEVPEEFWARALVRTSGTKSAGMVTADLFLFDDEGRCFAGLTKVTFRRVGRESLLGAAAQQDYRNWLYRLEWQTKESEYYDAQLEPGKWLIVSGDTGLAETLRATLESQDQRAVCVSADDEISFGSTDELPLRGVIYLSGDLSGSCRMGHRLVQAISQQRLSLAPRLCFVTRGTQAAGSRPVSSVAGAPLWGLANVLAAEHPELRTVMIDLDSEPDLNEARSIIEEILTEDGETRIAFRKGLRYVERLARVRPQNATPVLPTFHGDCTYLITGGLGAIGLEVAGWMVKRGARHLALVGRSEGSDAAQNAIRNLRRDGAEVLVHHVDVGDAQQVAELIAEIGQSGLPLRGVMHAAGVLKDGLAAQQDWDSFEQVMRPKVAGAWNLHEQTAGLPLDFFVIFSSAAAFMPNPGQASYSAANNFLDSLAHLRKGLGLPALSVNWGLWKGLGMASGESRMASRGVGTIDREQGLAALDFLWDRGETQIAVLPFDWEKYLSHFPQGGEPPFLSKLATDVRSKSEGEEVRRNREHLLHRLEEATVTERQEIVEDFIAQQVMEILSFESREDLDLSAGFFEVGLDSMMAVELQSRIQTGLDIAIPATTAFDQPNTTALARFLLDTMLVFKTTPPAASHLKTANDLSEDQLFAMFADEFPETAAIAAEKS